MADSTKQPTNLQTCDQHVPQVVSQDGDDASAANHIPLLTVENGT